MTDWYDFTDENDAGKARNAALFSYLSQRDKAATQFTHPITFTEVNRTGNTYSTTPQVQRRIYLPSHSLDYYVYVNGAATSGTVGYIKAELISGAITISSAENTWSGTYPAFTTAYTGFAQTLATLAGKACDLKIYIKNGNSTGTTYIRTSQSAEQWIANFGGYDW